jgi:hypothetical protein
MNILSILETLSGGSLASRVEKSVLAPFVDRELASLAESERPVISDILAKALTPAADALSTLGGAPKAAVEAAFKAAASALTDAVFTACPK